MPEFQSTPAGVPCYICGTDVGSGWIQGFIPSANAHKLGLCGLHDSPENRQKVVRAWQVLVQAEINRITEAEAYKIGSQERQELEITFIDGGRVLVECLNCTNAQETLQVVLLDKSLRFYPLNHIRQYALRLPSPKTSQKKET